MAVLLAFGLAASVTACGDVNTGEDKKEAATIGTTVESENVTGVSDTTEIQNAEEEYKSGCIESFDYNEYFRYPDKHVGERLCVTMQIVQLLNGGFRGMDMNGKIYITLYEEGNPNLQLDDIITVWGEYKGVIGYETTDENYMGFFTINAKYTGFVDEMIANSFQEVLSEEYDVSENFSETVADNPYRDSILLWKSYDSELSDSDVVGFSKEELRIARNEIYAAHGRIFTSQDLIDYFNSKPWYQGIVPSDQFSESVLTKIQKANIEKIKAFEEQADSAFDASIEIPKKDGIYTYRNMDPDEMSVGVEYMKMTVEGSRVSMIMYDTESASGNITEYSGFYNVNDEAYVSEEEGGIVIGFDEYGQYATVIFPWDYEPKFSLVSVSPLN